MAFTWTVRGVYAVGVDQNTTLATSLMGWGADPTLPGTLPWAQPEYPSLLITGISCLFTTNNAVNVRRVRIQIDFQGGGTFAWLSSGTITASQARRFEFGAGIALEATVTGTGPQTVLYREALPNGLVLIPGLEGQSGSQLTVTLENSVAADVLNSVTVRGMLLLP
jgi:hypothetical protein